jgi:antitoxin VapB
MDKAKVFWSGRSQAVRLPKEFRFEGSEVSIRRDGDAVILEPINDNADEWAWLDQLTGPFDDDFIAAVEEPVPEQERPELDAFFGRK